MIAIRYAAAWLSGQVKSRAAGAARVAAGLVAVAAMVAALFGVFLLGASTTLVFIDDLMLAGLAGIGLAVAVAFAVWLLVTPLLVWLDKRDRSAYARRTMRSMVLLVLMASAGAWLLVTGLEQAGWLP